MDFVTRAGHAERGPEVTAENGHLPGDQRLKALAERYALVTEAMSEGVYAWDVQSGALEISARLAEITGVTPTQVTAEDWNNRVHPDDFAAYGSCLSIPARREQDESCCR